MPATTCRWKLILDKLAGGADVVSALAEARRQLESAGGQAAAAIAIAERCFALPPDKDREAFAEFVERWAKKPQALSGEGTLREFLDYLELFIEAGGKVCRPDDDEEGTPATLLMESGRDERKREAGGRGAPDDGARRQGTGVPRGVCGASELEQFPHAIIRKTWSSFPTRCATAENVPEGDPKKLHEEEERRLFYVAVTRAEDELILCGKARSKKDRRLRDICASWSMTKSGPLAGQLEFREVGRRHAVDFRCSASAARATAGA